MTRVQSKFDQPPRSTVGVCRPGYRRIAVALTGIAACLAAVNTLAQAIPPEARRSNSAETEFRGPVKAFVDAQAAVLASSDAAAQSAARQALVAELDGSEVTDSFKAVYSEAVGTSLAASVASKDLPARLAAAIVAARVADRGVATAVRPLTLKLLADESEPIAVWGIRSARPLASGRSGRVDAEVATAAAAAAARFGTPTTTAEAYKAIIGDLTVVPLGTVDAIRGVQTVVAARIAGYATAAEPRIETDAVNFLANTRVWNAPGVTLADRARSADLLVKLLAATATRIEASAGTAQQQFREVSIATARAIRAVGREVGSDAIDKAAAAVANNTSPAEIKAIAANVARALAGVKGFESVKLE